MISRVANSCFWLTRYLERVDTWSRLLEVTSSYSLDMGFEGSALWRPLVIVGGHEPHFIEQIGEDEIENSEVVQRYLVWDAQNPLSIYSSARAVRENARTIREVMTVEMWEVVNESWLWLNSRSAKRLYDRQRDTFYERLCSQYMMFHGTRHSTMLREDPDSFMTLGRAVERVGQVARLVDLRHHALGDDAVEQDSLVGAAQWLAILRSCSAYEPFFKRATNVLSGSAVAQFLIFDRTFPRSVLYNLDQTRDILARLRRSGRPGERSPSWESLERLRGSIMQMDIADVRKLGLHETLTWIIDETALLCECIHDEFLEQSDASLRLRLKRGLALQTQSQSPEPHGVSAES